MKKQTLARFVLINYLCLLIVLLSGVWITNSYTSARVGRILSWVNDDRIMNAFEIYDENGAAAYYKALREIKDYSVAYFIILSPNDIIMDEQGSPYTIGYQISEKDANNLIHDPDTYAFYPGDSQDIVIVKLVGNEMRSLINSVMIKAWGTYSAAVVFTLYLMTRSTSLRVLRPVESLIEAVSQVGDGNYEIAADFEAPHELGKLKDALLAMSEKIQEENRLRTQSEEDRRQLVLNISHDIKTPLTNIRGYSETALARWGDENDALKTHLEIILNNSVKADLLLKNLFELSRIEHIGFLPNFTETDIGEVLRQILSAYIPELEAANIEYNIDLPHCPMNCVIDEALIWRAFSNLLDNSIRYAGGVETPMLSVTLRKKEPGQIMITVSDNGPGIPDALQEQVFKPFITADVSRNRSIDGTGLGLAITRAIIEKHRGTVAINKEIRTGACFVILLPCAIT